LKRSRESGKYDAVLKHWADNRTTIEYTDETGEQLGDFWVDAKNCLEWIKNNTPENSTFLCWWDYGHMIKGYTGRDGNH